MESYTVSQLKSQITEVLSFRLDVNCLNQDLQDFRMNRMDGQ